jgi:hypothetical protein
MVPGGGEDDDQGWHGGAKIGQGVLGGFLAGLESIATMFTDPRTCLYSHGVTLFLEQCRSSMVLLCCTKDDQLAGNYLFYQNRPV